MMKRILAICLTVMLMLTVLPATSMAATQYGYVTGGWLRLRSSASFNASTINSYNTGTRVTILGTSGSWYKVKTPDGETGYMYSSYISLSSNTDSGSTSGGSAYVTSSNGYGVRLRSGPGTGYRIMGVYSVGTALTVLSKGTTWSYITIGSRTGYMMTKFIANSGGGGGGGGGTGDSATIWSENGYGVRLRSGAGTGYSIIGVYSVGTVVTVLSHGSTWDYISVGSRTGYMMNHFLKYYDSNVVSAVALSSTTPVVGATLSAKLTPEKATVDYYWYVGSALVSNEATYTVADTDIGGKIKLTVVGNGKYTGTATSSSTTVVQESIELTDATMNNPSPVVGDVLKVASVTPANAEYSCAWYVDDVKKGTSGSFEVASGYVGKTITLKLKGTGLYVGEISIDSDVVEATGTITAVSITNSTNNSEVGVTSPNVGDKLTAVPEPSTASASYAWYRLLPDGTEKKVASTKTYTVASGDYSETDPCSLKVVCTGTSSYKSPDSVEATTGEVVKKQNITSVVLSTSAPVYAEGATLIATVKKGTATVAPEECTFAWTLEDGTDLGEASNILTLSEDWLGQKIKVTASAESDTYSGTVSTTTTTVLRQKITAIAIEGGDDVTVGDTLTAVFTPDIPANLATASYAWYVNGSKAATTPTYTVKAADYNKTITVHAICSGNYTSGELVSTATAKVAPIELDVTISPTSVTVGSKITITINTENFTSAAPTFVWTAEGITTKTSTSKSFTIPSAWKDKTITVSIRANTAYTMAEQTIDVDSGSTLSLDALALADAAFEAETAEATPVPETTEPAVTDTTTPETTDTTAPESTETTVPETTEPTVPEETDAPETTDATAPETTDATAPENTDATAPENIDATVPETTDVTTPVVTDGSSPAVIDDTTDTVITPEAEPSTGSENTVPVENTQPAALTMTLLPTPSTVAAGTVFTATPSENVAGVYVWSVGGTPRTANNNAYTIVESDLGGKLSVTFTADDGRSVSVTYALPASTNAVTSTVTEYNSDVSVDADGLAWFGK